MTEIRFNDKREFKALWKDYPWTPVSNLLWMDKSSSELEKEQFWKESLNFSSWRTKLIYTGKIGAFELVNIKQTVEFITKQLQQKPISVKILGSEPKKNYIWSFSIEGTQYVMYYTREGTTLEVSEKARVLHVIQHIRLITETLQRLGERK